MELLKFALVISLSWHFSCGQECGVCQPENEVQCVDSTSYHLCMGDRPLTSATFKCESGSVCSNTERICEPEKNAQTVNVCAKTGSCGQCPTEAGSRYTCVSRTAYARCINGKQTNLISNCQGENVICVQEALTKLKNICIPTIIADYLQLSATCPNDEFTSTTTAPTTPSPETMRKACETGAAAGAVTDGYFLVRNSADQECRSYIYCEKIDDDMVSIPMKCKSGYFNSDTKTCQTDPVNCDSEDASNGNATETPQTEE